MNPENSSEYVRPVYRPSFDIFRVVCMALIILIEYGLEFIPFFSFLQPYLYFSQGALFTVYGYLVLRDGADLRKNILHALKVFVILLVVYGALTAGYCYLMTGSPFTLMTRRNIFNFAVLNLWPAAVGASIWYVQATLYSLLLFWIFRKLKNLDWLFCILFYAIAFLLGEFSGLIHFNFLGYTYIPGNFLTRTMPYMLLGRLIHKHYYAITSRLHFGPFIYFATGFVLSTMEYLILNFTGYLVYPNHFIGFPLMAASACIFCVEWPGWGGGPLGEYAPTVYKGMYYVFNPLGYAFLIGAAFLCKSQEQYDACQNSAGILVLVVSMAFFLLAAFLKSKLQHYYSMKRRIEEEYDDETEV